MSVKPVAIQSLPLIKFCSLENLDNDKHNISIEIKPSNHHEVSALRTRAGIPFTLAKLTLTTHSLNALTCSRESSDSTMFTRRPFIEHTISFLVNRKQITVNQSGEKLLRSIALAIRNLMPRLFTAS